MHVEINDPRHCTIIAQPPGAKLHPSEEQARTCRQCKQHTWAHTSECMWCGYSRAWAVALWALAAGALALIALFALSRLP